MDAFEENMRVVERLLRKYGQLTQANWIEGFLESYLKDINQFYSDLLKIDFWGKLCVICDNWLYPTDGSKSNNESLNDTKLLDFSLIRIYEELELAGYPHPKIKGMVDVFRYWIEIDAYKTGKTKDGA